AQRVVPLVVRYAVEVEEPVGDRIGGLHLVDRLFTGVLGKLAVAPVGLHLAVQEVLVDGRQFGRQDLVELLDDLCVAVHLPSVDDMSGATGVDLRRQVGLTPPGYQASRAAGSETRHSCSVSSRVGWHEKQLVPAPQRSPISASVPAPCSIARRTLRSETPSHRQINAMCVRYP